MLVWVLLCALGELLRCVVLTDSLFAVRFSNVFFVVIGNCEVALAMCLSRHICCAGKTRDDKGAFTAHLCYQCWASEETDRSLEGLFTWRYKCLGDVGLFEEDEWESLDGSLCGRGEQV